MARRKSNLPETPADTEAYLAMDAEVPDSWPDNWSAWLQMLHPSTRRRVKVLLVTWDGTVENACTHTGWHPSTVCKYTTLPIVHEILEAYAPAVGAEAAETAEAKAEYVRKLLVDRNERLAYWARLASEAPNVRDRIKAGELLGKAMCDFTDNVNLSGKVSLGATLRELDAEEEAAAKDADDWLG